MKTGLPIRYSDAEMRKHPLWQGPPDGQRPPSGIRGRRLDLEGVLPPGDGHGQKGRASSSRWMRRSLPN